MVNSKNLKPVQWYKDTSVIKNIQDAEDPLFLEWIKNIITACIILSKSILVNNLWLMNKEIPLVI